MALRFSLFYFALFGALGLWMPYLPVHFAALGFGGGDIALLSSIHATLMIGVPPLWGYAADRSRRVAPLLRLATFGAALAFAPLAFAHSVPAAAGVLLVFGLFYTPISGLADSLAVVAARRAGVEWSRLRMWGSVGFVLASTGFSLWRARGGAAAAVVPGTTALLIGAAAVSLGLPRLPEAAPRAPSLAEARRLLADPRLLFFFLGGLVHWAALSPFHLFLALHIEGLGLNPVWTGVSVALAVGAEVLVMWAFRPLARRWPLLGILALATLAGTVRWGLMALLASGPAIALLQLVHGLSFGAFFVASITHLERTVPPALRATGRALFGSLVFGLGSVAGNALAGALYDAAGSRAAFGAAALLEIVPPLLFLLAARLPRPAASAHAASAHAADP